MDRLGNFIYYRAKFIIAAVVILNIISLISFHRFELDTNFLSFFSGGNPKAEEFKLLNEKYQSGDIISVLIEGDTSLLEKDNLHNAFAMRQAISAIPGVSEVQTFIPPSIMIAGSIIPVDADAISNNYESLKSFIEDQYFLADSFLSKDHSAGIFFVNLDLAADTSDVLSSLKNIADNQTHFEVSLAGDEVIKDTLKSYLTRILITLLPCVVALIIVIFYIFLRSRLLTIAALQPAGFAALWTFGTLFWSGTKLSIVTVITPIFIVVIGSAYGLHYASRFTENPQTLSDRRQQTVETLRMTGVPILISAATTMAGFVSLVWTDVMPMRDMGIFVTVGIGYAGLISLLFTPALLSLVNPTPRKPRSTRHSLEGLILTASRHRLVVVVIFVMVIGISVTYIPRLDVVSDQLMFFKKDSEIRQTFDKVERNFGDPSPLIGEIVSEKGLADIANPQFANRVLLLERELEALPGIVKVTSIFDVITGFNKMVTGEEDYPDNPMAILGIISSQAGSSDMWVSDDGFRLTIMTQDFESDATEELEAFISSSSDLKTVAGMPLLFEEMNTLVVDSQLRSLGLAAVLIFIMLFITFRRIRVALSGLLPVVIAITAVLGMLSIADFGLNVMTATLSAICIGVGVDYAVHMISAIHYFRHRLTDQQGAIRAAISSVSNPILGNALAISVGLSVLFFSPLRLHFQVASIMWVAMTISSAAALLLLPVLFSQHSKSRGQGGQKERPQKHG